MRIVIIGAGIGGCAAYLALKRHLPAPAGPGGDHEYIIYEAYDTSKNQQSVRTAGETHSATLVVGGGIGLGPNGLNVLKRLDGNLFHDVVRAGYPYSFQQMKAAYGGNLMRMPTATGSPPMSSVSMSRQALWNCLRDRIPDEIIVNKRVSNVVANYDGRNVISFGDGSPDVEADLVIGADGLKSITKRALFAGETEDPYPPHYEGVVGIGGFVDSADLRNEIEPATMALNFGRNGFFGYCYADTSENAPERHIPEGVKPPGEKVMWWSTYEIAQCPDPKTIDTEAILRDLRERHGSWKNPVIQKIISKVQIESMWPVWTTPQLSTWEKDGAVLIGDAAHALPPTSGQGSAQALEDAECFSMLLAHCLKQQAYEPAENTQSNAEKEAIRRAARKHMDIRRPRVKAILDMARRFESKKRQLTVLEEWLMYLGLFIAGRLPTPSWFTGLLSYNISDEVSRVIELEKQNEAREEAPCV